MLGHVRQSLLEQARKPLWGTDRGRGRNHNVQWRQAGRCWLQSRGDSNQLCAGRGSVHALQGHSQAFTQEDLLAGERQREVLSKHFKGAHRMEGPLNGIINEY